MLATTTSSVQLHWQLPSARPRPLQSRHECHLPGRRPAARGLPGRVRKHVDRDAGPGPAGQPVAGLRPGADRFARSWSDCTVRTGRGGTRCVPPPPESRPSLAALLREAGVTTALLTDEPQVARHPLAVDFDELIEIDPPWQPQTAGEIEQTHFARCFVQMIDWLEAARGPFLLWCHLGGLGTTWDAPLRVPPGVLGAGRSAAARLGRRARPNAPGRLRSRRVAGHRAVVRRPGDAAGHVPRRVAGVSRRPARRPGDLADAHLGARVSAGRASARGAVRRRPVRRAGPRALDDAVSRRGRRRRAEPGAGRAGRPLGDAVGLVGRRRRAPPRPPPPA